MAFEDLCSDHDPEYTNGTPSKLKDEHSNLKRKLVPVMIRFRQSGMGDCATLDKVKESNEVYSSKFESFVNGDTVLLYWYEVCILHGLLESAGCDMPPQTGHSSETPARDCSGARPERASQPADDPYTDFAPDATPKEGGGPRSSKSTGKKRKGARSPYTDEEGEGEEDEFDEGSVRSGAGPSKGQYRTARETAAGRDRARGVLMKEVASMPVIFQQSPVEKALERTQLEAAKNALAADKAKRYERKEEEFDACDARIQALQKDGTGWVSKRLQDKRTRLSAELDVMEAEARRPAPEHTSSQDSAAPSAAPVESQDLGSGNDDSDSNSELSL